jgi:hypothetical protein
MSAIGVYRSVAAGALATLTMDMCATVMRKSGLTAGLPVSVIGRWFGHIVRGRFRYGRILDAPDVPGQVPLAVCCHYLIGITLTVLFVAVLRHGPVVVNSRERVLGAALAFGLLTNALPWLVMFPAMGFGWFGLHAPPEYMLLRSSLLNHVGFGLGLALSTWAVAPA